MAKTKIVLEAFLPTTSTARVGDAVTAVIKELQENHRAGGFFITYSGPYPDNATEGNENGERRLERRAAEGSEAGGRDAAEGDGGDDSKPAKRGRGRPRKAEGSRTPPEGRGRDRGDEDDRNEDARGNEPVRTRKGADEGPDGGEEGQRGSGRGRDNQRGNREAARISTGEDRGEADDEVPEFLKKERGVKSRRDAGRDDRDGNDADDWGDDESGDDDGWGDEGDEAEDPRLEAAKSNESWPNELLPCKPGDIDKTVITTLLGEHFKAAGGKDRQITFDVMEKVTNERALKDVDERDYVKLAKALMKDAARYEFGLQK